MFVKFVFNKIKLCQALPNQVSDTKAGLTKVNLQGGDSCIQGKDCEPNLNGLKDWVKSKSP